MLCQARCEYPGISSATTMTCFEHALRAASPFCHLLQLMHPLVCVGLVLVHPSLSPHFHFSVQ